MQTNYAAKKKKDWIEHVKNDDNPDLAFAQNYLLHFDFDDIIIRREGYDFIYLSDLLSSFKKFEHK